MSSAKTDTSIIIDHLTPIDIPVNITEAFTGHTEPQKTALEIKIDERNEQKRP